MYCCSNCFNNTELDKIIESISTETGDCDFCGTKSTKIIDTREMAEFFTQTISLYKVDKDGKDSIGELIQKEWQLFKIDSKKANNLLGSMFADESSVDKKLFSEVVINYAKNCPQSKELVNQWQNLRKEIVSTNRFFIENAIDLDSLKKYLIEKRKKYTAGTLFYRDRISDRDGFGCRNIGKPPNNKATSGRANPQGIPYLYLSSDSKTTLYESRATFLDYVTIGTFQLTEDIEIVKLRTVDITNPFEEDLYEKLVYQPFLQNLESELSRPLRRHDSDLEYLPTQYLCEFIKHIGYEGVEYGSAMRKDGINIAFFDDKKFNCIKTEILEVKDIEISAS